MKKAGLGAWGRLGTPQHCCAAGLWCEHGPGSFCFPGGLEPHVRTGKLWCGHVSGSFSFVGGLEPSIRIGNSPKYLLADEGHWPTWPLLEAKLLTLDKAPTEGDPALALQPIPSAGMPSPDSS